MESGCSICDWILDIKSGKDSYLIKELETGYAVLSKYQFYKGYTLFLSKEHKAELHQLRPKVRTKFLSEMADVADAVYKAVRPVKMNYELLGNSEPHLHWHIIPRSSTDPNLKEPIWIVNKNIRTSKDTSPSSEEREQLKASISKYL